VVITVIATGFKAKPARRREGEERIGEPVFPPREREERGHVEIPDFLKKR